MTHTFPELKHKTLVELREIAVAITPAVQGYTQMNKDHLLEAVCNALNIDMHVHHEIKGVDKGALKAKIRDWKKKRDEALAAVASKPPDLILLDLGANLELHFNNHPRHGRFDGGFSIYNLA